MGLQGNLRDFAVTEILQLLGTQKKSGCLLLEWNTERARVYVMEGRIVSTRDLGMAPDDPLLKFLIKIHRVSKEQLRGLQTIQKESKRDLEELLVNGHYLDADDLAAYLERQILDEMLRLVRWENGTYRFEPRSLWHNAPIVKLSMEGMLIEAARRVDEERRFVTQFKDPYQLLGVRDLPDPDEPLSEEERDLFGIVDGRHTVAEVVERAPLTEYEAYEALFRMLDARWIEFTGRRDPGLAVAPSPARAAGPPAPRRSLAREALVGAVAVGLFLLLHLGSRSLLPPARGVPPAADVFVGTQLRDVRFALDLYRRDRGSYPADLATLASDHWVAAERLRVPGYRMRYQGVGDRYHLELQPAP